MKRMFAHQDGSLKAGPALHWVLWMTAMLAVAGIALSLFFSHIVRRSESERAERGFEKQVDQQYRAVREALEFHALALHTLEAYVQNTAPLDQDRFAAFAAPLMAEVPGIQALEWLPRVTADEREDFERSVGFDHAGYRIVERSPSGVLQAAGVRDEYYPVHCLYPFDSNHLVLGFDVSSEPQRRAALWRAVETGRLAATAPIELVQQQGAPSAYLVFLPVWDAPATGHLSRSVRGLVLGVFRAGDMINGAMASTAGAPLPMVIEDMDASTPSRVFASADVGAVGDDGGRSRMLELSVGGRRWQMRVSAPVQAAASPAAWIVLIGGLVLTTLTCFVFLALVHGRAVAERLVANRTAELNESSERLRTVADLSTDFVFWRGPDGAFAYVSPAAATVTGYHPGDYYSRAGLLDEIIAPDDRDEWDRCRAIAARGDSSAPVDLRIVARDGGLRWVRYRHRPVVDPGRGLLGQRASFTDITDAKLIEEYKARELRLFMGGPVVVFRWGEAAERPVEYVSPNVRNLLGVEADELINGRPWYLDLIHPDDRERAVAEARRHIEAGAASFQMEYRLCHQSGRVLHALDFTVVVRDRDGRVTHNEGYVLDVSEREQARRELAESKQHLDLAVAGADLGLWDWDVQTGHVAFSDGFVAMLGYGPGELAPRLETWSDIVHPEDLPAVQRTLQAHLDGETAQYETEHRLRHRDGRWIWVLDRGGVLQRDADGRPLRAAGTHLDITELRRVGELFRDSLVLRERTSQALARCTRPEEIAETAQQLMSDATHFVGASASFIVRLDILNDDFRVVNSWGREPSTPAATARVWALCGQCATWWPLTESLCEPTVLDLETAVLPVYVLEYLRGTGTQSVLLMVVHAGPEVRYLVGLGAPRAARAWQPPEVEFARVMRDAFSFAQQRVELNRQNEQTREQLVTALDRAEQANKLKITFLARMSHEIRTPMTAIVGLADVLRRSRSELDAGASGWLDQIQRNAVHLLALLNDLLDMSKIDAGEMQISSSPVPMHDVLDAVESSLLPRARERGLEFLITCPPEVPVQILTDRLRLRQILLNLGTNAIKFTDRGRVDIELHCAGGGDRPGELVVVVRDTGVGIAADQQERIFKPFMQAPGEDLAVRGGTGLGLDIARRLARALGGDITVVSQEGLGSAFTLRLPLFACEVIEADAPATSAVQAAREVVAAARLGGRRLLVVDDNRDSRQVTSFYLEEAGAIVETAVDGAEGVRKAQAAFGSASPYDAILMDMRMPVMNGYRATLALRRAGVTTPIVALTAHVMEGDERACLNSGCNAYIGKPVDPVLLISTIAALLPESRGTAAVATQPMPKPGALFSAMHGTARFAPLLARYLDELPNVREEMAKARAAEDRKSLAGLVHRLHGTGTCYGFEAITRAAGACEKALRSGAALDALPDLEVLDALLAAACEGRTPQPSLESA